MNFTQDLAFGKTWEETAARLVGGTITLPPKGCFKPYDFISDGVKYEVKADRLAYKYGGNTMFIEFECSGQPSGISTTEADVWMYFMVHPSGSYKCYSIPVSELRKNCEGCPIKKGGDGYRSRGYIVKTSSPPLERTPSGVDLRIHLPPPPPLVPRDLRTPASRTPQPSPPPAILLG